MVSWSTIQKFCLGSFKDEGIGHESSLRLHRIFEALLWAGELASQVFGEETTVEQIVRGLNIVSCLGDVI